MKSRSFNRELIIATRMLMDVFNEIVIDRRNSTGQIQQLITVPCVYGNRDRILKSGENYNKTLEIPIIALSQMGITKDIERVHSVNDHIKYDVPLANGEFDIRNLMPIPINIDFNVSIITKYQEDMDQILCNFVPFFNPTVYITWPMPNGNGNLKTQVLWDGSINMLYPTDITEADSYRIIAETNFTVKTFLFPGMWDNLAAQPYGGRGIIYKINFSHANSLYSETAPITGQLDSWYDVKVVSIDEFIQNVKLGYITYPNFDKLPISAGITNSYFENVSAELSGTTYNPHELADLIVMLDNVDNPDLTLKYDGVISTPMKHINYRQVWTDLINQQTSGFTVI